MMYRVLLITFAAILVSGGAAAQRPNIVFIISDDHAYQAISAYGDKRKLIETPNIDRLAKEGMRFDRCLVNNSLCGPSRACIISGTYSHINGMYHNTGSVFDPSQITFPKLLQASGYQTATVGKWHLVSNPVGFDYWEILPGQGIYYNPTMIRNGERVKHDGYVTDIITDLSIDWLRKCDKSKPFLLMCQNKAPHRIWEPNLKDLDFDRDRKYDPPATLFDDYSGRGIAEREATMTIAQTMNSKDLKLVVPEDLNRMQLDQWNAYYEPRNAAFQRANLQGADLVRWKYNRFMHDYLGCIRSVDENVGRLLRYLEDEGLTTNTIVVYTSDQGFYLGEHGWFDKRWIFEESLRTPLIVRWSGVVRPGSVNKDLVANLDFAETFLEAAGLPIPDRMQGRSMVSILKARTPADWRKSFYYHYYEWPGEHRVRPQYGVVTDRYKLVHFYVAADYWELFDLQKDPMELKSVFGTRKYASVQHDLERELSRLRVELKEPSDDPPGAYGNFGPSGNRPKK
jgi:arylsulfatase A-like enzyme